VREGSLDADIDDASIVPNDFHAFFAAHPGVEHVFFNGARAEHYFHRYVHAMLAVRGVLFTRLPSTSPAHASRSFAQKLDAWQAVAAALKSN
jgi:hypoxanthine-DNA glycosylase